MYFNFFQKNNSLDNLFNPNSIAVVGASNDKTKIGGFIFSELLKSSKKIYPVNLKWKTIQGHKCYPSISQLPLNVDLVIIAVPSSHVIEIVEECSNKGLQNVVVISAGFKEIGIEGIERENRLKKIIKEKKINVLGPNCLGFLNPDKKINASFAKELPINGDIALLSQSGAIIDAIIDWSFKSNVGFSKIVSLGNMAGINEIDFIEYLESDKKTKSIVLYMENISEGKRFANLCKRINKPVVLLYPGKSENAQKAIGSHTGSLAHDSKLSEVLFSESGIIMVKDLNELFNTLKLLKNNNVPKNENVVIITNAGGLGVLTTDSLDNTSLKLREISNLEKEKLSFLPSEASLKNPIDILGDATSERYVETIKKLDSFENLGSIVVLLTPQVMTDSLKIAKEIGKIARNSKKTIVCSFVGHKQINSSLYELEKNNLINFETPEIAINCLNKVFEREKKFKQLKNNLEQPPNIHNNKLNEVKLKIKNLNGLVSFEDTKKILEIIDIDVPNKIIIRDLNGLDSLPMKENKTYVAKIDGIVHKKDIGGVQTNINCSNYKDKIIELSQRVKFDPPSMSITLEEQVDGHELFIGLKKDYSLGNFILFGFGGTYINIINRVSYLPCPITSKMAQKLINESSLNEIFTGFRGDEPIGVQPLIELMKKLSYLLEIFPEIKEVDLNPIIINRENINLVDIKILI